ncbi:signal peptidase I [Hathewaya histolytica]|uniref:Signal peptidase I n=1 Tax=Hathewaya histolytica TaxID=1498 RepID=A0A4U9R0X4_HATHI|nr:signal peptidase I [Hathewaya histolytica]VTQ84118.1 signal peptidase I [Hathewaya histolytica]
MSASYNKYSTFLKNWILPIVVAFLIAGVISRFIGYVISVPTGSMYPTITPGDKIITTRIYKKNNLKRGDIIVFDSLEYDKKFVKRLIGLPGDKINIEKDGTLYINGKVYNEPYIQNQISPLENYEGMNLGSFEVPEGKYFFLGDNRTSSNDSRYWKEPYISSKDIKGKARIVVYPFNRIGKLK